MIYFIENVYIYLYVYVYVLIIRVFDMYEMLDDCQLNKNYLEKKNV